jgi:hypothetical protein
MLTVCSIRHLIAAIPSTLQKLHFGLSVGDNSLRQIAAKCGPSLRSLHLTHLAKIATTNQGLVDCISKCPNLESLSLCVIDGEDRGAQLVVKKSLFDCMPAGLKTLDINIGTVRNRNAALKHKIAQRCMVRILPVNGHDCWPRIPDF